MGHPKIIWADDGESPYFYVEGEERPESAACYVLKEVNELERLEAENKSLRKEVVELENALLEAQQGDDL